MVLRAGSIPAPHSNPAVSRLFIYRLFIYKLMEVL